MSGVSGHHNAGMVKTERDRRQRVDDVPASRWRVIAGVKMADSSRPMALGAVGVKVGASAVVERGRQVRQRGEFWKTNDARFVEGGIE